MTTVRREAMSTTFAMTVDHDDARYVRQAAEEAWHELARLEELFSRFVSYSDVSRLGRLQAGSSLIVDGDTLDCLRIALGVERETQGAFNIAYRSVPPRPAGDLLRLADQPPRVHVHRDRLQLDLGGIGKGYALDRIAALLIDWDLPRFQLQASSSTILAGEPPRDASGWPIQFGPKAVRERLRLRHAAISGSGTAVKGDHIIDPHSGRPAQRCLAAWAGAPTAALADGYSTALMVMPDDSARQLCRTHPDLLGYVQRAGQCRLESLHTANRVVYL